MKIGEAARRSGLSVKTVRYYADIGLIVPRGRSDKGYRRYDEALTHKLIFVRRARAFGFSLNQCRELLSLYDDRSRASADVKRLAAAHLMEIEAKMNEMRVLQAQLRDLVDACRGDDRPDCAILSGLATTRP